MKMADPIALESDIASALWEELPLTLRDDELTISEDDPEEDELMSHENDAPEDTDITGAGLRVKGTFIKASREQMVALMGGSVSGTGDDAKYAHSATKLVLKKSIKITCYDGTQIIIPSASGYVNLGLTIGRGGRAAFPFNFRCLKASPAWDCDILL